MLKPKTAKKGITTAEGEKREKNELFEINSFSSKRPIPKSRESYKSPELQPTQQQILRRAVPTPPLFLNIPKLPPSPPYLPKLTQLPSTPYGESLIVRPPSLVSPSNKILHNAQTKLSSLSSAQTTSNRLKFMLAIPHGQLSRH